MADWLLAALGTLGWVALTALLLFAFGRTEGGGWSIAGTVARGVRDWSRVEPRGHAVPDEGKLPALELPAGRPQVGRLPDTQPATPTEAGSELEDLPSRRL